MNQTLKTDYCALKGYDQREPVLKRPNINTNFLYTAKPR